MEVKFQTAPEVDPDCINFSNDTCSERAKKILVNLQIFYRYFWLYFF